MNDPIFINADHNRIFAEEGYIVLDLLSESSIASLREIFNGVEAVHSFDFVASILLPDLEMRRRLNQEIAPIFERDILPVLNNYKIILGNFASKRPQSYGKMPLHQDSSFVDEHESTGITIWCPLVDTNEENGWLGIVPGSHTLRNYYREANTLPYGELHAAIESNYLTYLSMKAGQVLLMDNRMIHGSPANRSDAVRPVAAGVAIAKTAPLICCYINETSGERQMNIYEVPDDFYVRHTMLRKPSEGRLLGSIEPIMEPLTLERLEELCPTSVA